MQVNREREIDGRNTSTTHYYLTSLKAEPKKGKTEKPSERAKRLGQLIRRHWAIENELHWSLDVTFGEDNNRNADKNAAANLGTIRRTAITLLKQDTRTKRSLRGKAYRAFLNPDYMMTLLQGNTVI